MAESKGSSTRKRKSKGKTRTRKASSGTAGDEATTQRADSLTLVRTPGEADVAEVTARGLLTGAPWQGGLRHEERAVRAPEAAALTPPPSSPVLTSINRAIPPAVVHRDKPIVVNGEVVVILRRDVGFPSGPLPADPGRFPPGVDPRQRVCGVLSPVAAARCLAGRGYF